jgi:hypothetical protein
VSSSSPVSGNKRKAGNYFAFSFFVRNEYIGLFFSDIRGIWDSLNSRVSHKDVGGDSNSRGKENEKESR